MENDYNERFNKIELRLEKYEEETTKIKQDIELLKYRIDEKPKTPKSSISSEKSLTDNEIEEGYKLHEDLEINKLEISEKENSDNSSQKGYSELKEEELTDSEKELENSSDDLEINVEIGQGSGTRIKNENDYNSEREYKKKPYYFRSSINQDNVLGVSNARASQEEGILAMLEWLETLSKPSNNPKTKAIKSGFLSEESMKRYCKISQEDKHHECIYCINARYDIIPKVNLKLDNSKASSSDNNKASSSHHIDDKKEDNFDITKS